MRAAGRVLAGAPRFLGLAELRRSLYNRSMHRKGYMMGRVGGVGRTLLLLLLAGCGGDTSSPAKSTAAKTGEAKAAKSVYRIAVIPKGPTHDFWKSIHAGALKAKEELGNVEVLWNSGPNERDSAAQIGVVENFITQKVDAIVLAPTDKTALVAPVMSARRKGIPVVIIDSGIATKEIDSFVATDNFNGGKLAARELAKQLGEKGNVAVLRYMVGSDSTENREAGFLEAIKEFPNIKVASSNQYAGATENEALRAAENMLTALKGVDGWFCPCEPVTAAVVKALDSRGLAGKTKVVGFDAGSSIIPSFKAGKIHGLILQDPVNMGYLGVKTAMDLIQGKKVEARVSTGETVVTAANFDDPKIRQLHSPDLKKYLKE
jgi:ribose transport system substrate-binding protein